MTKNPEGAARDPRGRPFSKQGAKLLPVIQILKSSDYHCVSCSACGEKASAAARHHPVPFLERPDPARQSGRRAAPPADAMAPRQEDALLHEVHLHAEHEEDVGDDAFRRGGSAPRRASRLARRSVGGLAAPARVLLPRVPAAASRRPPAAPSCGRVRPRRAHVPRRGRLRAPRLVRGGPRCRRGARLSRWAAPPRASLGRRRIRAAVATLSGDVRVITRVGALVYYQRARDRPRVARAPVAGVALAAVPCDDPGGAPGRRWIPGVSPPTPIRPPRASNAWWNDPPTRTESISIRVLAR